ncbi:MAG TPA: chromate transporter [Pseudothermotoga sp.]|nr:chromate transporter [Pseudothermotoga sp.]
MFLKLVMIFLKIGFFAFGGGWAIVGILKDEMVSKGVLSLEEFVQAVSIAQMTPGPVAINLATYTGYKYYGFFGALINTFVFLLAPISIVSLLFFLSGRLKIDKERWSKALTGITIVMVAVTMYSLVAPRVQDLSMILIATAVFFCISKFKIHPLILIFSSGLIGIIVYRFF